MMSNYSDVFFASDANRDTASPSSKFAEADSDRKGDSATGPTGLCILYEDFLIDLCTDAKEQQYCLRTLAGNWHNTILFLKAGTQEGKVCATSLSNKSRGQVPWSELAGNFC